MSTPTDAEKLEALKESNKERLNTLAAKGVNVDLTGGLVDSIIERLWPEGTEDRAEFSASWEARCATLLDGIEAEVRRAILLPNGAAK